MTIVPDHFILYLLVRILCCQTCHRGSQRGSTTPLRGGRSGGRGRRRAGGTPCLTSRGTRWHRRACQTNVRAPFHTYSLLHHPILTFSLFCSYLRNKSNNKKKIFTIISKYKKRWNDIYNTVTSLSSQAQWQKLHRRPSNISVNV